MLKSAVIKGLSLAQSRSITLPFRDSSQAPYFIKAMDGLGPVNADISMASYPDFDEDLQQSSRVGGRSLTFRVGLRPRLETGETVGSLRRAIYKVMPPKTPIRITLNDDEMSQTYIDGTVESLAPPIFDKGTDIIITVKSGSAYLTSTTIVKNQGFQTNKANSIVYDGDAPTPFEFTQKMVRACTSVSFKLNNSTLLTVAYAFNADDTLSLVTTPRAKILQRTRGTSKLSLLDNITAGSLDLFIDAATDTFGVYNNFGNLLPTEKFFLTYSPKYVGV